MWHCWNSNIYFFWNFSIVSQVCYIFYERYTKQLTFLLSLLCIGFYFFLLLFCYNPLTFCFWFWFAFYLWKLNIFCANSLISMLGQLWTNCTGMLHSLPMFLCVCVCVCVHVWECPEIFCFGCHHCLCFFLIFCVWKFIPRGAFYGWDCFYFFIILYAICQLQFFACFFFFCVVFFRFVSSLFFDVAINRM